MIKLKPISQKQKLYLTCARICFYQWRLRIIKKNQRWPYLHLHWAHNQICEMIIIMAPPSSSFIQNKIWFVGKEIGNCIWKKKSKSKPTDQSKSCQGAKK